MNFRKDFEPKLPFKFSKYDRVIYIPPHANGDLTHHDVESGYVSSVGNNLIFVKFDLQLRSLGWNHTTSRACPPCNLRMVIGASKYELPRNQ